jgi:hypothetical protein
MRSESFEDELFMGKWGFHICRNSLFNVSYTQHFWTEASAGLATVRSTLRGRLVSLVYCSIYFQLRRGDLAVFISVINYRQSTAILTFRCCIKLLASPEVCKSINTLADKFQGSRVPRYSRNSPHVVLQHRVHQVRTNSGRINFVRFRLIFVCPQYLTCFIMSPLRRL